jgi:hypothetical protein
MRDKLTLDRLDVLIQPSGGFSLNSGAPFIGWYVKWRRSGTRPWKHFNYMGETLNREVLLAAIVKHDEGEVVR